MMSRLSKKKKKLSTDWKVIPKTKKKTKNLTRSFVEPLSNRLTELDWRNRYLQKIDVKRDDDLNHSLYQPFSQKISNCQNK